MRKVVENFFPILRRLEEFPPSKIFPPGDYFMLQYYDHFMKYRHLGKTWYSYHSWKKCHALIFGQINQSSNTSSNHDINHWWFWIDFPLDMPYIQSVCARLYSGNFTWDIWNLNRLPPLTPSNDSWKIRYRFHEWYLISKKQSELTIVGK